MRALVTTIRLDAAVGFSDLNWEAHVVVIRWRLPDLHSPTDQKGARQQYVTVRAFARTVQKEAEVK